MDRAAIEELFGYTGFGWAEIGRAITGTSRLCSISRLAEQMPMIDYRFYVDAKR